MSTPRKFKVTPTPAGFRRHLAGQIRSIERHALAFDQGDTYAVRKVCTDLRVIFHETRKSMPLLAHLNGWDVLIPGQGGTGLRVQSFSGKAGAPPVVTYQPFLGDRPRGIRLLPAKNWWKGPIVRFGKQGVLTREMLVLATADQDGGAHVDKSVDAPGYAAAMQSVRMLRNIFGYSGSIEDEFEMSINATLRDFAWEVLNSAQLRALCGDELTPST